MCGITGLWQRDGRPVAPQTIERFTRALAHRGPDGHGTLIDADAGLALGHRRLAILDPTPAGAQPMRLLDDRYWVTFNGEIYNFVELRTELESDGYRFTTASDTEVIGAAYDRWGHACQLRFNGMWAFALWDRRRRELFVSRDRFGVKPLLYISGADRFAFASELKAFLALDGFDAREEPAALTRALCDAFAAEAHAQTPFVDVLRLAPGHHLHVTRDGLRTVRWWNTLDHRITPPRGLRAQADALRALIFDAARLRLRSDVPVATALSGGLDSSSILCTLTALDSATRDDSNRQARSWRRAFTASFDGTPLDERAYAESIARHVGIPLDEIDVSAPPSPTDLAQVVWDLEEPTFTNPAPIWSLYRALRAAGVTVALNGDGADELFGGYLHHTDFALADAGGILGGPRRFADLIETRYRLPGAGGPIARTPRWKLALDNDAALRLATLPARRVVRLMSGRRGPRPVGPSRAAWIAHSATSDPVAPVAREAVAAGLSALGAHLYAEFHTTKLPKILRMFDRASMAHGVEIRNAFLDWHVVRYAFSLPDASLIGGGFSKRVLREAMRGIVPDAVRLRRGKIGFNAPLPQWFAGPLREWLWEFVNDRAFMTSDLWDGVAIRDFVAAKRAGAAWQWGDGEAIWPFIHTQMWRNAFTAADRPR